MDEQLQSKINEDLLKRIDISQFKAKQVLTMKIKNTIDIKCKKCGSENIYVRFVQMRGTDEATSRIYECLDCKNTWIEN
jgi:DNA-directed RNA polymerase subunit M/transcription elongation factor TFIIS